MKDRFLGRLKDCVEAPDDRHRQYDVSILAAHVLVAQHVVRDSPYEVADIEANHAILLRCYRLLYSMCESMTKHRAHHASERTAVLLNPVNPKITLIPVQTKKIA